jgi:uncharacterized protein YndB with AHSA1/START domain
MGRNCRTSIEGSPWAWKWGWSSSSFLTASTEVEPPSRLVYTWRWDSGPAASEQESLVTVTFDDLGDWRTEVAVTHDRFPPDHDPSPYRSGWEHGLEKLDTAILEGDTRA